MNVWGEMRGTAGRLGRKQVDASTERVLAGTVFAEHVFTRLLAAPDQRRIVRLEVDGYPGVPEVRYTAPPPQTAQEAPAGARWLDDLVPDTTEYAFTLDQTDSNQHVNSLTYVRIFLDALNRRLAAVSRGGRVRSRAVDIAYRKPAFAGDRVRAHVRLFEGEGDPAVLGGAGYIAAPDGKPHCYVRAIVGA
jgi:hypothetical protein